MWILSAASTGNYQIPLSYYLTTRNTSSFAQFQFISDVVLHEKKQTVEKKVVIYYKHTGGKLDLMMAIKFSPFRPN